MPIAVGTPEEGQLAQVRERRWFVSDVAADSIAGSRAEPGNTLVTLESVEDDALGEQLQVIWELEPGARVLERSTLPRPTGLDQPHQLDALLDAVRWAAVSTADHKNVQSPFRSGVDIEDYQLDPVIRAIDMPRSNLLIADDVGLGKTIEAGLIMLELILRHRARRILIVCPAGLQLKWQDEMREKFGLEFRVVDAECMKWLRRNRGIHANPWNHFPRLITSIDYLKRDRPLQLFRETLPAMGESPYPRRYDLLVLDEAQNCAPFGRGKYALDSQRTAAIRELTPHFEHKLFLSATPHNGYRESFWALLELLDDQRFSRGTEPDDEQQRRVVVRRLKEDIKNEDGSDRFPKRELEPLEVEYTAEEREAHALLGQYRKLRMASCSTAQDRFASEFVLKTLKKRLFSSPLAFLKTLEKHRATRRRRDRGESASMATLRARTARSEEDFADELEFEEVTEDALASAASVMSGVSSQERDVLDRLEAWAKSASNGPDSKCQVLLDFLKEHLRPHGDWSDERVLIFTEYRDTQKWLVEQLAAAGLAAEGRLKTIYGGMNEEDRERIKAHFQHDPTVTPVRILVATDCASEGVDLQLHCSKLVHIEIPWNPNRLEQRNGRIDRRGQKRTPFIYHFVGKGYRQRMAGRDGAPASELDGELEFLMRAAEKVDAIRRDLGSVGTVIAEQVEEAMLGKRRALDTSAAERRASEATRQLKFERNVAERVAKLRAALGQTRQELRLDPSHVGNAVSVALEIAQRPALIPVDLPGVEGDVAFRMPIFEGSWQRCGEGLEDPVSRRVRPITFDHRVAEGRHDVVLAHLNHRLVQMCLGLLRSEVWRPEERKRMHRVTARLVPAASLQEPALVVHGRIMVVGARHHRLHEELVQAGGTRRGGRWERLGQSELDALLAAAGNELPSGVPERALLAIVQEFEDRLQSALEARMRERAASIERELDERRQRELSDIEAVINELIRSIQQQMKDPEQGQLYLEGLAPEEREQFELNRSALERRIRDLPHELAKERAEIEARYASPTSRPFPLAVTVLVPEGWRHG
jgi:superfamily II DNA or RNA helicase